MKQGFWTRSRNAIALLVMITMAVGVPARVYANPEGGVVTAGQATITVRPNVVDVHQQSDKAILDWRSFDIDHGETTEFHQPNTAAIALNRVHSSQASVINGALKANGNVIVVNQNGVLFGRNAKVDVNGLLATTADIDNDKFMNQSKLIFDKPGNPTAAIVNQGQITAKESGLVGFVAPNVQNDGIIAARLGRVHLAAGDKATVDFYGDGLMEVAVSDEVRHQLVQNSGTISADGGAVALTAAAGSRIIASSLEVGGTISAQTAGIKNGRIVIAGLGGNAVAGNVASAKTGSTISTVRVAGHLNASGTGSGQKGGSITVTGDKVHLASSAKLNASGHSGGGDIKVGGDFYGAGTTPTANLLLVDHGASLLNDAIYIGSGGTTALWSDGGTNFAGSISNRGGQFGGNGGFVEVSGKQALGYHGTVDTRAPMGRVGTLLLDPADITISNAANSNISGSTPFGSTGATTSNLNVTTLIGALGTSNVTITTAPGTGGQGDVTFIDPVSWNSTFGLTVTADRHINVNAAITNAGTGGITLNANVAGSIITVAAPISTGGNIALSAAQDLLINAGLTAGGTLNLTATNRDIITNASGILGATGALTTNSGRDTTFGANITSGGNVSVAAARDITLAASRTLTTGATNNLSMQAAGGSTAGTGNLNLNGNLSVGTGTLTLVSGINGTRPSWTANATTLLRQGATFGVTNISGFLNLIINRDLNSSGGVTLTANNTGGSITVGAGSTVSGSSISTNSNLNTTINGALNSTGGMGLTSAQDLLIGAAGSVSSTGNMTFTVTRDTTVTSGGVINVGGILNVSGRDATFGTINGGNQLNALVTRNITTLAGTTQTSGAANGISFQAAGGSQVGTGNLTLNGNLSVGTGGLTLVSGINGTRPSWTATTTNLVRQGATFGAVSISGFLNLTIDRQLNSSAGVSLSSSATGGNITVNNGASVTGTALSFNSNLNTTINGAVNASSTLGYTSAQDLVIGATGTSNSTGNTTVTVTRDVLINGAVTSSGTFGGTITRDLIMSASGSLNAVGNLILAARDITLGNVGATGDITATATRDLTTLASTTITPASNGALSLYAANNVVTGTGNLTLNGILNVGTGALNLTSGVNGTRPSWTMTNANLTMQGASMAGITISGFLDTFINRDINSTGHINITSFRDLTIGGGYTVSPGGAFQLNLRAANNVTTGTGALYINGILNAGTGNINLISGTNGGRPNITLTSSNLTMQGATFGGVVLNGFENITVDRDITSNGNISMNAYGDITVNAGSTITSGNTGGISLTAANNVATGAGNLILNGVLRNGTGALVLTSGDNGGGRPSLTWDGTNIQRIGAAYGAITINGFLDTFITHNVTSNGNVSITSFRDLTLNALNSITTGTTGSFALRAANGNVANTGSLYINGTASVGTGGLTLLTGVTGGVRQDFTWTSTNITPNNTNFGTVSLTGFQNITFDRNVTSTGSIAATSQGDITVNAPYIVRTGTSGTLTLQAANNSTVGTGNLNINGVIGVGTGGAVLTSGINGTRPSWTINSTNLLQLGSHLGLVNIQGFLDLVVDRNLNAGSNLTLLAMRNLTINAGYTVGSASSSATNIRAAGGVLANVGQLLINGNISAGAGALTLLSGHDGSGVRPTFLANDTTLARQSTSFGTINIQGFGDFIVDRVLNAAGTGAITFANNTRLVLRNDVQATGTGTITITNPTIIDEGSNVTVSTVNRNIQFNVIDDTPGGVAENLTVDAGTGNISFNLINGVGLNVTGGTITLPGALGGVRPLQDVSITAANTITLPNITADRIFVRTTGAAANIVIAAGRVLSASAAGDAIILAAGQNFLNNSGNGTNTLLRPGGGRYIIYSVSPSADTQGGLTYDERRFSCTYAGPGTCAYSPVINATIAVPTTGNVFLYSSTPILLAVVPQAIANIIYGSSAPNLTNYAYVPFTFASGYLTMDDFNNDVITGSINGQTNYTQGSNVGNYNISYLSGELSSSLGYGFDYQTLNNAFSVTPRHVTVDLMGLVSKVYNGNTTATLASGNYLINNIYSGDVATLGVSNTGATYDTKNVGTGKTVTANGLALTGTPASNYVLDNSSAVANVGTITQRALTISATGTNRVYDATTNTTVTLGDNRLGGDVLVLGYGTAAFVNKNVGTGKTVNVSGITLGGADAGNYSFNTTATTTANITARALTITAAGVNKVYNGNNTATVTLGDNRLGGDVLTLGYGTALFSNKNVGTGKAINVSGITLGGADAGNYSFNTTAVTAADITARALTISATGVNKVYNGNNTATVTLGDDRVGGDVLTLGYGSALFGNKNVANGKVVSVSGITLGGADAGNYTFNTTAVTTANITPRALTISATGANKVYDGNATASVTLGDNRLGGDVLTLGYGTALFGNKNVGTGKAINVSGITLGGADAGNYSFNTTAATAADITARALTITAAGVNKVYNGNTTATVTLGDDRVGGDVLTLGYGTALFGNKNVANGKAVSVSGITLGGADAGNYSFNTTAATAADITPRALTISATGVNRVYDTTTGATVTLGDDRIGGDLLTLGYGLASFGTKDVANGKAVNVSGITLGGADAGNYTFNTSTTTTANITPYALTITASGIDRVYNGTTGATVTLGDNRLGGDVLTLGYGTALFGNKNVGTGKAINVSGITLGGADAGNYSFNTTAATTADITARALTITATGVNKVYNGNTTATVTLGDDRVGGDVLTLGYGSALFGNKNVANGKVVSVSGITLGGADAGNYTFNTTAVTTANITPRALTISATGVNRVYDTTTGATVTLGDDRIGGDLLTLGYGTASFGNKNVGIGKTVNVSGITLGGADAGNYSFNTTAATTANITARALTISATGVNKVYNGNTTAIVTLGDDRIGGDVLTLGYGTALFGNKNVGTGKAINVSGITLGGADAGNYTFNTSAATAADITPRVLTISAIGVDRVYDATTGATVTLGDDRVGGDVLTLGYGSALFGNKNVANGKTINVSGITLGGADAGNYTFNTTAATTANITPRALAVTASGIDRVYNGTAGATVTLGDDRIGGDVLIVTYGSALFGDKNVGNGKAINVSGISLAGADAGNYSFNTSAATTANITPRALVISASGVNRVYNGTTGATVTLGDDRVGGDVLTLGYGTAAFGDKNVANGKTINVSGITLAGADAGNYSFNTSTTTTANITPYALIISATGSSKVYDGTDVASVTLGDNRIGGDLLTIGYGTALFPDKNAGTGRTITVSGITLGGADAGNYTFNNSATATADITKATLTVTAANQNIIYGTAVPGTTLGYSGFVGGEGVGNLGTAPVASSAQNGIVNAGTYTNNYTVGGGVDGNYSFVYVPGTLTVGKKTLTVTANGQTVTYGTAVPGGTLTYSGFIAGQDETFLIVAPTVNSAQNGIVNAGSYANNYTVGGGVSNNYDFSYFNGNLVVTRKDLNVTADNISITYGASVPAGTLIYNGFVNGDTVLDLDVAPSLSSANSGVVNAGTYTNNYTVGGGSDGNYTFHYAPGTLTVTPAGLNVTVNNQSITYGTVVPGTTITYSGFVNGDTVLDLDVAPSIGSAQNGIVGADTYTANYTASGGVSGNYTFNYIPGNLVVSKKALNVTAGNRTVVYGTAVPTSALSYSGFITGEGVGDLISAPTIVSGQSGIVNAGTYAGNYAIVGGASDNYYFNFTPGDLTVSQRTLTVSALPQTVVYGTAVPVGSLSYSGFISGEGVANLTTAPTLSSANSGIMNAGTYVNNYTVGGGVSSNYTFVYAPANLVVSKATLNVTANGRTITYGTAVPGTTLTYSGFISGEGIGDLGVAPTVSSTNSGFVNAGTYTGNYVVSGGVDTNYDFAYTNGTLQVNAAALTISALNINHVYGSGNTFNGYSASGLQLGETIGSVVLGTNATSSAGGQWNAGTWNITASGATGGSFNPANYTISYLGGTMVITPRTLTVTPTAANRVYDGTDHASVVLGDDRITGDAITLSYADARFPDKHAGANRIVIVSGIGMSGADAGNYTVAATASTTATITQRVLVVVPSALNKLHDGNTVATVTLTDNRLAGDVLTVGYGSANFADANVGTNKVVTVSGISLLGPDGGNYSVAPVLTTTASIFSTTPPVPVIEPPPTVVKVSQDTGSVFVTTTDDGIYATPSTGYQLIYLPYDAPDENRWRNKPLRAGVGGVPIIEPTAWYGWIDLPAAENDDIPAAARTQGVAI